MKYITIKPIVFDSEYVPPPIHDDIHVSLSITVADAAIAYTMSRTNLFEGCCGISTTFRWPRIEVKHADTWTNIGRAYYASYEYRFTEFHCTLCSVDELKHKVAERMREYERNRVFSDMFAVSPFFPEALERYLSQRHWNEDLYDWIEGFRVDTVIERKLWEADERHSCRPYKELLFYQHQLAKLSLGVQRTQARAASRPCCRSFLMTTCHQSSGDDPLGH